MRKFFSLPGTERRMLLKALLLVAVIRAGLTLLPLAKLRSATARLMVPGLVSREGSLPADRIAWCVSVASRYIPAATCLTQALTAQIFLVRRGYDSVLRIGVARDSQGAFAAHAWVEQEGSIIIGELGHEDFTPLPQIGPRGL